MNSERNFENTERYLSGKMTKTESADFEQKMAIDPELQEDVDFTRKLKETLKHQDALAFRKKLKKISEETDYSFDEEISPEPKRPNNGFALKALLLGAILVVIGVVFWQNREKPIEKVEVDEGRNLPIADLQYQRPYPFRVSTTYDEQAVLLEDYRKQEYGDLGARMEKYIQKEGSNNHYMALAWGSTLVFSGELEEGTAVLQRLTQVPGLTLYDAAKFYLTIAEIKKGNLVEARANLTELRDSRDRFVKEEARKLEQLITKK